MTKEEIIDMAREAGFFAKENEVYSPSNQEDHELTPYLKNFAKLIAEKERERLFDVAIKAAEKAIDSAIILEREGCARVCEDSVEYAGDTLAEAIRARGQ